MQSSTVRAARHVIETILNVHAFRLRHSRMLNKFKNYRYIRWVLLRIDESLYKLSPIQRKKIFLDLKRKEKIRLEKEEEKRLEKLKKD